jgi:hypothetical protein
VKEWNREENNLEQPNKMERGDEKLKDDENASEKGMMSVGDACSDSTGLQRRKTSLFPRKRKKHHLALRMRMRHTWVIPVITKCLF